ncbi:hypothetical protein DFH07DRAFT_809819 [Mycena maculata]|uniref:MYND-type domain-containing protein n=1 Tax=Mycena maculata TaxID=230809 RepID=A0AAD7JMJ0_9AGAR|nr:hypothetical protein DFH07DRAFT_809819 [Mycena maculata]
MSPHPSLDLRNMYLLPRRLQKSALRAFRDGPNATLEDLFGISQTDTTEDPIPPVSFLPLYYNILWVAFAASPLTVLHALETMLQHSLIPDELLPDLWPEMWRCMTPQARYIAELSAEGLDICSLHLSIIRQLGLRDNRAGADPLIVSSPGMKGHLTLLWGHFLRDKDLWSNPSCTTDLSRLLTSFLDHPPHEDIIEAAGGTHLDVASLVIKQVHMITSVVSETGVREEHLGFLLFLRGQLVQSYHIGRALDVLDFLGPLKKLATVIWPTVITSPHIAVPLLDGCLPLIDNQLAIFPGPRESIDSRLLVLLARCGIADIGQEDNAITNILGGILPGTLTFYAVLSRVEKGLRRIDALDLTPGLRQSGIWNYWLAFRQLAEERLVMKSRFDEDHKFVMFCDNIECLRTAAPTDLRRCSRCRSASYCSFICQRKDWTAGEHRNVCRRPGSQDLEKPHLPARERAFLRYLLHHDYLKHMEDILDQQVEFFIEFGSEEPFYTQFNYIEGALSIEVLPTSQLISSCMSDEDSARGKHEIARLARSADRMQLHVAVIANAGFGRFICCPLRTVNAELPNTLSGLVMDRLEGEITDEEYDDRLKILGDKLIEQSLSIHQPIYSWIIPA